jgi:hypothetical protein
MEPSRMLIRFWIVLGVLGVTGCASSPLYHASSEPLPTSRDELWQSLRRVVTRRFTIDEEETDEKKLVLVSSWELDPSFDYLGSFRRRVEAKLISFEDDKDKELKDRRWQVKLSVVKQTNQNIDNPYDAARAEWGETSFDSELESMLLTEIEMEHVASSGSTSLREPEPERYPVSADGRWTTTGQRIVTHEIAWDALLQSARVSGYREQLAQPEIGRYTSEWELEEQEVPELSRARTRLIAEIVSETTEGYTFHTVRIRVERQERSNSNDPWFDVPRSLTFEQILVKQIDELMRRMGR